MDVVRFALLGLGIGALYALASQGLLVIYRGSGVLNFSQGAIGMVGAYLYWEMTHEYDLPSVAGWIIAVGFCALIGVAAHVLIMRQ
jgi:branched-subunit amino acid ABC-type transport system permease component